MFVVLPPGQSSITHVQPALYKQASGECVHKAHIDSTAYSLFPFETFIFSVTPTIMHSHLLSFVTNSRSLHKALLPSLETCHPRVSFRALVLFSWSPGCMRPGFYGPGIANPSQKPLSAHRCREKCCFFPAALGTSVMGGQQPGLGAGEGCPVSCRHIRKSSAHGRLAGKGRVHPAQILLLWFAYWKSRSPISLPMSVSNLESSFKNKNRISKCDSLLGLAPFPVLLHVPSLQP